MGAMKNMLIDAEEEMYNAIEKLDKKGSFQDFYSEATFICRDRKLWNYIDVEDFKEYVGELYYAK